MSHKLPLLLFCLLAISTEMLAQNESCKTVSGTVRASGDGIALEGVHINIGDSKVLTTNSLGYFRSSCIIGERFTFEFSHIGFEELVITGIIAEMGDELEIELDRIDIELREVLVERNGLFEGKNIEGLPGSSHLLSLRDLQKFDNSDIHKALISVPGVYIQEEDGYGLRPNIGMRGTGVERSSKITLMEDGVLIAPAPYSASAAYYFPSIARMHAVEIRKGSSQVKFGPQTTGGSLNLVSTPIPSELAGKVNWSLGSNKQYQVHANAGSSSKYAAFLLETLQHGSDGFKEPDFDGTTGFKKQDYLAKALLQTSTNVSIPQVLIMKLSLTDEDADETYLGLSQDDFSRNPFRRYASSQLDNIQSVHKQAQIQHIARFSESLSLRSTVYQNNFERDWFKLDYVEGADGNKIKLGQILSDSDNTFLPLLKGERNSNSESFGLKHNNRSYYSRGIQSAITWTEESDNVSWIDEAEFGLRIHRDEMDRFQWVDRFSMNDGIMDLIEEGVPGTESNRIEFAKALSFHLQSRHSAGQLSITPGLRFEKADLSRRDFGKDDVERTGSDLSVRSNSFNTFVPGIGIDFRISGKSMIFGGVHRGFSPPGSSVGSKPELSINYELGFRKSGSASHYELVAFYSDYSNLLGSDLAASGGGGSVELFNGGKVKIQGLEGLAKRDFGNLLNWRLSLPVSFSYTLSQAKFEHNFESDFEAWGQVSEGDYLPYLPEHKANLTLGVQGSKWDVFASASYSGRMRFTAGQEELSSINSTDDPLLVGVSSSYQLSSNFELFAKMDNLLDKSYIVANRPFGLRPGMPRRGSLGVRAKL